MGAKLLPRRGIVRVQLGRREVFNVRYEDDWERVSYRIF